MSDPLSALSQSQLKFPSPSSRVGNLVDGSGFLGTDMATAQSNHSSASYNSIVHRNPFPVFELPANGVQQCTYLNLLVGKRHPASRYVTQRFFQVRPYLVKNSEVLSKLEISAPHSVRYLHESTHVLPNIDPDALQLYIEYQPIGLHSRLRANVEEKRTWRELWPFINGHILGVTIRDTGFADLMIDILVDKVRTEYCADRDTIRHVFEAEGVSNGLKRLLVEHCVEDNDGTVEGDILHLPKAFVDMMACTTLKRLRGETQEDKPECFYHSHGEEQCYRKKFQGR